MVTNIFHTERIYTPRQLSVYIGVPLQIIQEFSDTAVKHYHPHKKKINGKKRVIANPSRAMLGIQRRILRKVLNLVPLPNELYGARPGRNLKQNAELHLRQPVLVTIDLRDCFPSVSYVRVFRLFREDFMFSEEVSRLLTNLTTYRGCLPQGAATSAMLLNILLIPLCNKIRGIPQARGKKLSFWVDDIAISGTSAQLVCQPVIRELQKFGFRTRSKKVKIMFSNKRQTLTGLITNSKISVPKDKLQQYIDEASSGATKRTNTGRLIYLRNINKKQERRFGRRVNNVE